MSPLRRLVAASIVLIGVCSLASATTSTRPSARPALETNVGQVRFDDGRPADHVDAMAKRGPATSYLHANGAHTVLRRYERDGGGTTDGYIETQLRTDMSFLGGNPFARVVRGATVAGPIRYYVPGVQGAAAEQLTSLTYVDVWPNIDVRWIAGPQGLKYEFIVRPGGNPHDIAVRITGATSVELTAHGALQVHTPMGSMTESAPVSWMSADAEGMSNIGSVDVDFRCTGDVVRFTVRDRDPRRTLVIDPTQVWSTYYSGNGAFEDVRIAMDPLRNVIMAGTTYAGNLPTKVGVVQRNKRNDNGNTDGFVTKFDEDGHHLWSTYYGSTQRDGFKDVAADSSGKIYAVGYTNYKDAPNIFIEEDSVQKFDMMVLKLTPNGEWIDSWASGGRENDLATAIDISGPRVTIVGYTNSPRFAGLFGNPYAKGGAPTPDLNTDAFICRYTPATNNPDRANLTWFTFFGGSLFDDATSVRSNAAGDIFVCGRTNSTNLPNAQGTNSGGLFDAYVVRFPVAGGALTWCTYLGGSAVDEATDIAVDNQGTPIVVGNTTSNNFPVSAGLQAFSGRAAGFMASYNAASGARTWSQCVAADSLIYVTGVATDLSRRIWISGYRSLSGSWTTTPDAFQPTAVDPARTNDGIIARYSPTGTRQYASFLCAPAEPGVPPGFPPATADMGLDECHDVVCDGDAYMMFANLVTGQLFPTKNAFQDKDNLLSTGFNRNAVLSYFTDCKDSVVSIIGPSNICNGQPIALAAPAGFASYRWSTGETTRTITVADTGTFVVACVTTQGCRYRDTLRVQKFNSATVRLGPDIVACKDSLTRLTVAITGGTAPFKYKWNRIETGPDFIDSDTVATPKVNPTSTSNYEVQVTDANGCISRDTVQITILIPQPTFGSSNMDFGTLDPCASSGDAGIIFRNPMPYPITLTSITSANGNISDVTPIGTGLVIPAGGSVDLMLRYTALAAGPVTGTIIARGTPCDWTTTIPFRADKARLVATVFPATLSFGQSLSCDNTSALDTVEVRNGSSDALVIRPGLVNAPFSIVEPTADVTIPPSSTQLVVVRYAPTSTGSFNETLRLPFSAGPCDDTLRVSLSAVRLNVLTRVTPAAITFPDLSGCASEVDTTITISNLGDVDATITWPTLPEILLSSRQPVVLKPGQDTVIRITVRPAGIGPYAMNITLLSQPCDQQLRIDVSGNKQGVSFDVPPVISFGEVSNCGPATVRAQGSVLYTGSAGNGTIVDVITGPSITTTLATNTTLLSGTPVNFEVLWSPTRDGALVDSIVLIFKPCDARRVIKINGTRTTAMIAASSPVVDLGSIPVGGTNGVLSFQNTGSDTLGLSVTSSSADVQIVATRPTDLSNVLPGTFVEVDYRVPCDGDSAKGIITATVTKPCPLSAASALAGSCLKPPPSGTAVIALDTARVNVGDLVTIPIRLLASSGLNAIGATAWSATISYDPFILVGTGSTPDCFTEGMTGRCSINVSGTRGTDTTGTIGELTFIAVLGYTDTTSLTIEAFTWTSAPSVPSALSGGRVEILDICREGGDRFLRYVRPGSIVVRPQPASDDVQLVLDGVEAGAADLIVHDMIGKELLRNTVAIARDGSTTLDVRSLDAGTYMITARFGGAIRSSMLIIAR